MQKIMIIDDEVDILHMLERYFRLNGYQVITAEGAEQALKKLNQQPDLILLDVNMPGMDGISCLKVSLLIKEKKTLPQNNQVIEILDFCGNVLFLGSKD